MSTWWKDLLSFEETNEELARQQRDEIERQQNLAYDPLAGDLVNHVPYYSTDDTTYPWVTGSGSNDSNEVWGTLEINADDLDEARNSDANSLIDILFKCQI